MSTETVLTPRQIDDAAGQIYGTMANHQEIIFAQVIEKAVLQSPEIQKLRKMATTEQAIQRAAEHLPVGYEVVISLEKNAGTVALFYELEEAEFNVWQYSPRRADDIYT